MHLISPAQRHHLLNCLAGGEHATPDPHADDTLMLAVLLPTRDGDGNPITKRWRDMTPAEREEWNRRNRNFLRF